MRRGQSASPASGVIRGRAHALKRAERGGALLKAPRGPCWTLTGAGSVVLPAGVVGWSGGTTGWLPRVAAAESGLPHGRRGMGRAARGALVMFAARKAYGWPLLVAQKAGRCSQRPGISKVLGTGAEARGQGPLVRGGWGQVSFCQTMSDERPGVFPPPQASSPKPLRIRAKFLWQAPAAGPATLRP